MPTRPVAPVRIRCMIRLGIWVQGLDIRSMAGYLEIVRLWGKKRISIVQEKNSVSTEITGIVKLPGRCLTTTTVKRNDD